MKKRNMTGYHWFGMCIYFADNLVNFLVDELKRVLVFTSN